MIDELQSAVIPWNENSQ